MFDPLPHTFHLTQRFTFIPNERAGHGFDRILRPDYMGSTEFECGAVGAAYRLTRKLHQTHGYTIQPVMIPGYSAVCWVAVLPNHDQSAIILQLRAIAVGRGPNMKESMRLDRALRHKEQGSPKDSVFDIDVWCTVPYYSSSTDQDPEFYPVWVALQKEALVTILKEATRPAPDLMEVPPVAAQVLGKYLPLEDYRLFDQVLVSLGAAGWSPAIVKGIDVNLTLELPDGARIKRHPRDVKKAST